MIKLRDGSFQELDEDGRSQNEKRRRGLGSEYVKPTFYGRSGSLSR
jgi:hypothetical protein